MCTFIKLLLCCPATTVCYSVISLSNKDMVPRLHGLHKTTVYHSSVSLNTEGVL